MLDIKIISTQKLSIYSFDNLPYVGSTSLLCHFAWVTPCTKKDTHMSIIYDKELSFTRLNLIIQNDLNLYMNQWLTEFMKNLRPFRFT